MSIMFLYYEGSWQNGNPKIFTLSTGAATTYTNYGAKTLQQATTDIPIFDHTSMVFARNSTHYNNLITFGWFTSSILKPYNYTSSNRYKMYFSPTKYMYCYGSDNNAILGIYDGTNDRQIIGSGIQNSQTLPSYNTSSGYLRIDAYTSTTLSLYQNPLSYPYTSWWMPFFSDIPPYEIPKDPYTEGGTSTSGGGGGSFDDSTDVIQIPSYDPVELLNRGYANRGFVKVYLPTQAQVLSLSNYLWSSGIDTVLKKLYADPIQCIISLSMIPLVVTSTITGNIRIAHTDTEITDVMIAENQFVTLDCGTIDLDEFWGSYLDYSPYTKLSIYLPFIGVRALNIDEFMSGTIGVKYVIDIVSGDCIAFISRVGSTDNLTVPVPAILGVLYQFNGNVSLQVPISAANFAQMYGASISAAVGGVGMLAGAVTGGLSAPMAIAGIAATAVNVASAKPSISHGGAIPSTAGWLGVQKPYLILQRPQQCLPENQNTLTGYPAYITVTIGDVEGYNEFEIMHLENIPATEQEKDEIERLLKSGVIL